MRRIVISALTALMLGVGASSALAATVPVQQLSGPFNGTNPSVAKVAEGVQYGVYHDAGIAGGSLLYTGANGMRVQDISALAYTIQWNTTDDNTHSVPYLRIFTQGDTHDLIFDPTECGNITTLPENELVPFNTVARTPTGHWRYDDDPCGPGPTFLTWDEVLSLHGAETISGIYVTAGFSAGVDLSAIQTDMTVNGDQFVFNQTPAAPPGTAVVVPGPVQVRQPIIQGTTTIVNRQASCSGNSLRTLHAPRRAHETFLNARASLRGRSLSVSGRSIRVDLRARTEGNYNVKITSRYRRRSGKVHRVVTRRNLSVVCS